MDAVETQRFADEFRHVTLAHERLVRDELPLPIRSYTHTRIVHWVALSLFLKLLCVCGCGGDDATLVADALKKIVRIKLQMNTEV